MEEIIHWRSQLFSALGAGFQDDKHIYDGIHLRWSSDPRLGLPFESPNAATGIYRVHYLHDDFLCLSELDLFVLKNNAFYPVHSSLDPPGNTGMDTGFNQGTRFFKRTDPEMITVLMQYFVLAQWLRTRLLADQEKDFLQYLSGVLADFQPELYDGNWTFEIGEVCAVDVQVLLTGGNVGTYAWVRGYDRQGHLLAEDWVGLSKSDGPKTIARLRSPHIYTIRIEPVKGMPLVSEQETCWIFCDEYCRANIWRESGVERRFQLHESAYTEEQVEKFFYGPFKVNLDWPVTTAQLVTNLIQNPLIQKIALQPDTYQMSRLVADLGAEDPADQETFPNLQLSVLASLIHAATDPAMANILGLYAWDPALFPDKRDYKVEAYLPFFNKDNLILLRDQMLAIVTAQGIPVTNLELEILSGLPPGADPGENFRSTSLCGLVLCPEISLKDAPYQPKPFTTRVTAIDLLSQEKANEADIYVNSRLQITKPPFTTAPYLQSVSYEVERRLSNTDFANVIDLDEKPDELDELGILPSVYMPKEVEGEDYWELRDDFRLPLVQQDTVQYRLKAFDIFGRPSDSYTGSIEDVPIPCYEPVAATSLSAQVNRDQDDLNLELYFAITGTIPPLHATPQTLEITIHPVDPVDPGPVDQITWTGSIFGRTFTVNYLADGTFLDEAQLAPGCASLTWSSGQLDRTTVPAGDCDADFPLDLATLSLTAPALPVVDEAGTGYRLYRLQTKIGDGAVLNPGPYRWCIRVRIQGLCESGTTIFGRDVSTAAQYNLLPPPPAVVQPPLVAIPESTYPDRQGDAYYNLDLSEFIPAAIANDEPMVNVYSALLPHLTATPEDVVDGEFFAPNGDQLVQTIGRAARQQFQRVNETPIVYTPANRFYPIHVRGDLEQYHVVGVVGCNAQLDEKDWRDAGILLFKTPQPVPMPLFRFVSVRPSVVGSEVHITLDYHADFAAEVTAGTPLPKVQITRHDLSTGAIRFAGESTGVWDANNGGYHFQFIDTRAHQWRRYRYEASLLLHADKLGQMIKSEQTTTCKVLAPETGTLTPYIAFQAPFVAATNGEIVLTFTFIAGDFNFSVIKTLADNTSQRVAGQLVEGEVQGVPDINLTIDRGNGRYTFSYLDSDTQPGTYTLRLWQGQRAAWPQKLEVTS